METGQKWKAYTTVDGAMAWQHPRPYSVTYTIWKNFICQPLRNANHWPSFHFSILYFTSTSALQSMQINLSSQKGSVRYLKRVRAVRVITIHKIFFRNPVKLNISNANDYYLVQTLSSHGWMLQESQLSQYMLKSPQQHFLGNHWLTKKSMSYQTSCLFCATVLAAQNLRASFPLPFCTFEKYIY